MIWAARLFVLPWGAPCRQAGSRQVPPQPKERKEQGPAPSSRGEKGLGGPRSLLRGLSRRLPVHSSSPRGSPARPESRAGGRGHEG